MPVSAKTNQEWMEPGLPLNAIRRSQLDAETFGRTHAKSVHDEFLLTNDSLTSAHRSSYQGAHRYLELTLSLPIDSPE